MQKLPHSICANAGIAPSAKLKMTLIRTDRIMAFPQQEIQDQIFYLSGIEYSFLSDRPACRRPACYFSSHAGTRLSASLRAAGLVPPCARPEGSTVLTRPVRSRIGALARSNS